VWGKGEDKGRFAKFRAGTWLAGCVERAVQLRP